MTNSNTTEAASSGIQSTEPGITAALSTGIVVIVFFIIIVILAMALVLVLLKKRKGITTNQGDLHYDDFVQPKASYNGKNTSINVVSTSTNVVFHDTAREYDEIQSYYEPSTDKSPDTQVTDDRDPTQQQQGEQHDTVSTTRSIDLLGNYEVYMPTNDERWHSYTDDEQSLEIVETYWAPAGSINELYKQLSSKKYREIASHQLELVDMLGAGEFGNVSKGIWKSPVGAMEVAVKQLRSEATEEEAVKFLQEAAINGQFRHPNVVKLMGVVTTGEQAMIVLELLSCGDLMNFLKNKQPQMKSTQSPLDQQILLRFCQQVASGMEYLSKKDFVHRDLASRNILLSGDLTCKISDFGMSRNLMDEHYYVSHGGKIPVKWTAPEAIHYKKYSTASDVWSFGCVMYEIWSLGHKPFENHTNPEAIKMVDEGYRLPPPPGLPKELYKIMIHCWQPKSLYRPTFSQLVEMLSRAEFELFVWEEDDLMDLSDPQMKVIGAPLEVAQNLYLDIQNTYKY